jgi:hypothetical protein
MIKTTLYSILEFFTLVGIARAAANLSRLGYYDAATQLMLDHKSIKENRRKRKETGDVTYSLLQ